MASPFPCQFLGQHAWQRFERLLYSRNVGLYLGNVGLHLGNVTLHLGNVEFHTVQSALKARMSRKHLGSQGANIRLDRCGFLVIEPGKGPDLNRKYPLKVCDPLFKRLFGHGILLKQNALAGLGYIPAHRCCLISAA